MSSVAHEATYSAAVSSTTEPEKRQASSRFLPLALVLLAVAAATAVEVFGPASVRMAFQNLDVLSLQGQSACLVAFITTVALHELGHLCAALVLQFEVLAISAGPVRFSRSGGSRLWTFVPKNLFAASISAIPKGNRHWTARVLIVIAAGPIATLLSAIVALSSLRHIEHGSWVFSTAGAIASLNLVIFFLGLIPNGKDARTRNDAQLFWSVLRNPDEAKQIRLYHQLLQLRFEGVRPRQYAVEFVRNLAATCNQGRRDLCLAFADVLVKCATDRGDFSTADAWHRRMVELARESNCAFHNIALAEAGCFDLLFHGRTGIAKERLSQVHFREISTPWQRHRLAAALHLSQGNNLLANEEIDRARKSLPLNVSYSEFEESLLERLLALSR